MEKINRFKRLSFILLCFLFITTGYTQNLESKIDKLLVSKYKSNQPGATALVAKGGKVIYRKAFGNANLELNVNMKPENVFEIGSMTKQFTAVSILMLLEQGKLNLDDEITKFIPDYPTQGKTIKVHHLLNHTSGIKSYTSMQSFMKLARNDMSPSELIDVFKNEPMDFDPGEKYLYNNSAYIILGYIIEKLSGQTYADFVENNIFKKIDMNSSHYGSMTKLIENRASGYQKRDGYVNADYLSLTLPYAGGSLMSNVDDMLKWQQAIKNNIFIKKETTTKAFTNYALNNGNKINYGYGWSHNLIHNTPTIEHGGGIFGYTTMGVYVPGEDVYVVVLTNCNCNSPTEVAVKIAALTIGEPFPEIENSVVLQQNELEKWVGAYEFEGEVIRYITLENGQLYSQREGSSKFKIFPLDSNRFYFDGTMSEYVFSMSNGKRETIFKSRINATKGYETNKRPVEKESVVINPAILKEYIGKYELQPNFLITVTMKDDKIFGQATGQPQFEMFAENTTNFFLKVVQAKIVFNKNDEGKVSSLILYQNGQELEGNKIE